jgi:hypothetical protein
VRLKRRLIVPAVLLVATLAIDFLVWDVVLKPEVAPMVIGRGQTAEINLRPWYPNSYAVSVRIPTPELEKRFDFAVDSLLPFMLKAKISVTDAAGATWLERESEGGAALEMLSTGHERRWEQGAIPIISDPQTVRTTVLEESALDGLPATFVLTPQCPGFCEAIAWFGLLKWPLYVILGVWTCFGGLAVLVDRVLPEQRRK